MKWLQTLRKWLFCTQDDMAAYLQVQRPHLAMAEKGRRQIPTSAHIQALTLYTETDQLREGIEQTDTYQTIVAAEEAIRAKEEQAYRVQTQATIAMLRQKLEAMEATGHRATATLAILPHLRQKVMDMDMKETLALLDISEVNARKSLKANSLAEQYKLRLRIAGLEASLQ
ncbi:hypothetical protein AB9P05_21040 [Roseivirga sp. BDSF3-8]|uniref:hypothetical protein n=1 Tax=Roseivirga sp. BDSF3-8 TaxID=3241598 RepID=UPI00353239EA